MSSSASGKLLPPSTAGWGEDSRMLVSVFSVSVGHTDFVGLALRSTPG